MHGHLTGMEGFLDSCLKAGVESIHRREGRNLERFRPSRRCVLRNNLHEIGSSSLVKVVAVHGHLTGMEGFSTPAWKAGVEKSTAERAGTQSGSGPLDGGEAFFNNLHEIGLFPLS